jgi:valyl-tRNA synthetase
MEKIYQPHTIESHWYEQWEKAGCFKPDGKGNPYCIVLPPPNVTGSLHMGHGFQHTLMDTLIRYHRMRGNNTLWQGGVDHAGIATQIVVERQLEKENQTRHSLGREKFIEKVWEWKKASGNQISTQMRRMGSSIDWSRECFTMDANFSTAVREAFTRLYNDKLIYRGKRLVNWDCKLQSAVSDLEVVFTEEPGHLWHIRYYLSDSKEYIVVATTRPETLFGDAAVAVHPDDERYKKFIGQQLKLPLTSRTIPVIADEYVDPSFGTGCVKITPAHDFNDYEIGKRHNLDRINILTQEGFLNYQCAEAGLEGIAVREARSKTSQLLENQQMIEKIEPYTVKTPRCERTGEIIQPYLTDQWYISMKPLAKRAIEAVEKGELRFIPENWTKTYLQWLENIQDWCISRQLWWGHRIPAFYDNSGNIFVGDYTHRGDLKQDEDVLDTWFSAALWPFATLGWPEKTPEFDTYYPTNVLVTGFDIIFFWVARMVMFGLYFTQNVPFKEVYITGLIRDQQGHKMSKSKGNVLDPIDLIDGISLENLIQKRTYGLLNPNMEKQITAQTQKEFPQGIPAFGTDALRFTYCALANSGRDIRFDMGRVGGYRNFCNKLWNAARFVIMNTQSHVIEKVENAADFSLSDQWILSRLQHTIQNSHDNFSQYRFDLLAQNLYEFLWYDYCDWYLEFSKINASDTTRYTLLYVLETVLRLLHPVMPYITEEIWQRVYPALQGKNSAATTKTALSSIQYQPYPEYNTGFIFIAAEEKIHWLKSIVTAIRNIRSEMQIPPGKKITVLCQKGTQQDKQWMLEFRDYVQFLARIDTLDWTEQPPSHAATAVAGELQLFIPLAAHINIEAETQRLKKEIARLEAEAAKSEIKLKNPHYIQKAPESVVCKEREYVVECQAVLSKLKQQLAFLQHNG